MDNTQQPTIAWLLEKTNAQALAQLLKRWPILLHAWEKGGFKLVPQSFENPLCGCDYSLYCSKKTPRQSHS